MPYKIGYKRPPKSGQFAKGKRELERMLLAMPGNNYVRTAYATLLMRAGETAAAETQLRIILDTDPANVLALEQIVTLCQRSGREEQAIALMAEASAAQPRNKANNTRLAQFYALNGDIPRMVQYLQALSESGPADASLYLELAQRLADLGRGSEAVVYAHQGRKAAQAEQNEVLRRAAEDLLAKLPRY